jgi:hypothetical protein
MTDDESPCKDYQNAMTVQDSLRHELLQDALGDSLPIGHVTSIITHDQLAKTGPAQQELALQTIRSLLEDGLMQVGDLTGEGGELVSWKLSVDETIARIRERFD